MFGFRLIHKSELKLWEERLADQKHMLDRMESELHYWQDIATNERERADRVTDSLMQQNGLPDVTATVIKEKKVKAEKVQELVESHEAELAEMFTDSLDQQDDLNWIDPDLAVAAQGWMEEAKKARESKTPLSTSK